MIQTQHSLERVLAIEPSSQGIGFAVLETPDFLVDWGVLAGRKTLKPVSLAMIDRLIQNYDPTVIVVERIEPGRRQSGRVRDFLSNLKSLVTQRRIRMKTMPRKLVRRAVAGHEEATSHELAVALARRFPEISKRLPRQRRPWMGEQFNMSMFTAVGIAISHVNR